MRWLLRLFLFAPLVCGASPGVTENSPATRPTELTLQFSTQVITNIAQFSLMSGEDFLHDCPFHLIGTVTMVDTNRSLVVLQDDTGAVAVQFDLSPYAVQPGQIISLEGAEISPRVTGFPRYPYDPAGWDKCDIFEAPSNWGDYHLTRMRGFLHPPATGAYTFWIASDNSSELWLSRDDDPARVRRIASVNQGNWVDPHEWSRFPSQQSEPIFLEGGHSYYVEAFQEQSLLNDHVAVAWRGPGMSRAVIDGHYLTPWIENDYLPALAATNGILREYWTNYAVGGVVGLTGPRVYESALAAKQPKVTILGRGSMPEPRVISIDRPLAPENRYNWVETDGVVDFVGVRDHSVTLELTGGQGRVEVRCLNWDAAHPLPARRTAIRVQGVCEGARDRFGALMPSLIWTPAGGESPLISLVTTNSDVLPTPTDEPPPVTATNAVLGGYYTAAGVVTFNDHVFGKDYLYIQQGNAGVLVSQALKDWGNNLQVGQFVMAGGEFLPGRFIPGIRPMNFAAAGWSPMPEPMGQWSEVSPPANQDGRWTELEGVGRSINPDGTLMLMGSRGPISIWCGRTPTNVLERYVDSTLSVRGVLAMEITDAPMLLVPSPGFIEVEEPSLPDPFARRVSPVAKVKAMDTARQWAHRVRVIGAVTWSGPASFFVQDASGGIRVKTHYGVSVAVGDEVDLVGFPDVADSAAALTDILVRKTGVAGLQAPARVTLSDLVAGRNDGGLVRLPATLLSIKTRGGYQVLDLQEEHRIFEAMLPSGTGPLAPLALGSRLEIVGVCDAQRVDVEAGDSSLASIKVWLRGPQDVRLTSGPPWWSWKETVAVVGTAIVMLLSALIRIYLLRRRLARQETERVAFARELMQRQEGERRRIAANLHDSLGQDLLVIKYQARLAMQPATEAPALMERLDQISKTASQALEEVRQITHDLRPYQLDRLGLTQAIRGIIRRLSENSSIVFASHVDDIDGLFDNESQINIYRIVQEGLTNVIKHSGASEVAVVIKKLASAVSISIRDNGHGFGAGPAGNGGLLKEGFGLSGIDERVRILGGTAVVNSQPGEGVSLSLQVPLPRPHHEKAN